MPRYPSGTSRSSSTDTGKRLVRTAPPNISVVVHNPHAFVQPQDIKEIVCHREHEFLVQWANPLLAKLPPSQRPHSWIRLEELKGPSSALYHVQNYVEKLRAQRRAGLDAFVDIAVNPRKRKQPTPEAQGARPLLAKSGVKAGQIEQRMPARTVEKFYKDFARDFHCWRVVEGHRITVEAEPWGFEEIQLPTPTMIERSRQVALDWAERAVADEYNLMLATFAPLKPRIRFSNKINGSAPPLRVRLIDQYIYGEGVSPAEEDTIEGCEDQCGHDVSHHKEHSRNCSCLEFAEVDSQRLRDDEIARFMAAEQDADLGTAGLPKRFPYRLDGTMQTACLESKTRYALFECNDKCHCGPGCRTKVTQRGRKYGLEIFKTRQRGWGLRCLSNLRKGDFIDMYYGRIITNEEAVKRDNNEYLFDLDKFKSQLPDADNTMLVVDGTDVGGVTRFINHSCEPNCAIFPISYNKNDILRYNLAFFALERIAKGEELTFDYQGQLEEEYEYDARDYENTPGSHHKPGKNRVKCHCGTAACRGYLFL